MLQIIQSRDTVSVLLVECRGKWLVELIAFLGFVRFFCVKPLYAKLYSCFLSWFVKLAGDVFFFQTVIRC